MKIKHKHNKVTHQHAHTWSGFPCKNTGVVGWCGKPEAAQEKQEKKKTCQAQRRHLASEERRTKPKPRASLKPLATHPTHCHPLIFQTRGVPHPHPLSTHCTCQMEKGSGRIAGGTQHFHCRLLESCDKRLSSIWLSQSI